MANKIEIKIYDETLAENNREICLQTLLETSEGDNPHQAAGAWTSEHMADYEVMFGETLNYRETSGACELANVLSEFYDVFAVAIMKEASLCGVALAPTLDEAYNKALDCDPMASFSGLIGTSNSVDVELAKQINSMDMQLVLAPDFSEDALQLFKNRDIKVVKLNTPLKEYRTIAQKEVKITPFGTVWQETNRANLNSASFKVVTKQKPTKEQIEDAVFAWKVSKYTRSNSAIIAKDFKTVAISQGTTSPVSAVENAMSLACDAAKEAVLVTDMPITTLDCIHLAVQGRISLIVQPGGSNNDEKLIETADKYGIIMAFTGIKNYKR